MDLVTALQRVAETQLSAVYAYIRYRVSSADVAEELTAKTFPRAVERLETFDPSKGELVGWVFGIARHAITDYLRAGRRWRWLPIDWLRESSSRDPSPELAMATRERQQLLAAAVAQLPDRERDVLGLKFARALTNREIAGVTGLRESHVGVVVYRAVRRVRQQLADTGASHG